MTRPPNAPHLGAMFSGDDQDWEFAKWLALLCMLANHVALALLPPWHDLGSLIGRVSLPVFALLIVLRLRIDTEARALRYLKRLAIWGLIAQPVYQWLLYDGSPGRLNVLFTLMMGVGLIYLAQVATLRLALLAAGLVMLGTFWLDGGAWMPLAQLAAWLLLSRSPSRPWPAMLLMSAMAAAMNIHPEYGPWHVLIAALAIPLTVFLSPRLSARLPRMPGLMFYGFYPAHLAIILLVFGPY